MYLDCVCLISCLKERGNAKISISESSESSTTFLLSSGKILIFEASIVVSLFACSSEIMLFFNNEHNSRVVWGISTTWNQFAMPTHIEILLQLNQAN